MAVWSIILNLLFYDIPIYMYMYLWNATFLYCMYCFEKIVNKNNVWAIYVLGSFVKKKWNIFVVFNKRPMGYLTHLYLTRPTSLLIDVSFNTKAGQNSSKLDAKVNINASQ